MNFQEKSLNTIELPAVLTMLSEQAESDGAKALAAALMPSSVQHEVTLRQQETSAAKNYMVIKGSPSFYGLKDVRSSLSRANLGGSLNCTELLQIAKLLRAAAKAHAYLGDDASDTCIDHLFRSIRPNRRLEEKISNAILGEDEISDFASDELGKIRRQMRAASAKVKETLQKIITSPAYAKALQDQIITTRSDRYVVPVKADHRGEIQGLVHDISSTGMTVFVEPMAVVKVNNELRELAAKEKNEIERILSELSADCSNSAEDIETDYILLTKLDLIFAKAKLSYKMNGIEPVISERSLILRRARHPLIDPAKVVPIDVRLGDEFDTLIITGPNTGGKTVSLKTLGLLSAMSQCGLHIPANDGSSLPVFDGVFADIGDEQSIEQSLSTFSSHMTNIVTVTRECTDRSLILFDELGAGTDPTEGAALAISIIEHSRRSGALVAATTHYAELKVYATNEPRVQNASCEFDVNTLRPTYRLLVGIPGKSNAFAIATRLGLDPLIVNDARTRVNSGASDFEATIEKLEQTRLALEKEKNEVEQQLRKASEEAKKAAFARAELEVRLEKADVKSKRDAERIINEARAEADAVFEELQKIKQTGVENLSAQEFNDARSELRRRLNLHTESLNTVTPTGLEEPEDENAVINVGDTVVIKANGIRAEVTQISADGSYQLHAGIMNIKAKREEIAPSKELKVKKKAVSSSHVELKTVAMSSELDLRGMDSVDAVIAAEQYLDNAVMAKLKTVRIVHGKGTGVLRDSIQQMLRKNKLVKSFRLGRYGEGETGVTVVELK